MGTLYYGDNLDILRRYLEDESVNRGDVNPRFGSAQYQHPRLFGTM